MLISLVLSRKVQRSCGKDCTVCKMLRTCFWYVVSECSIRYSQKSRFSYGEKEITKSSMSADVQHGFEMLLE